MSKTKTTTQENQMTTGTRVYVITPQGYRDEGTILKAEHTETYTTSHSWGEKMRVVTVEWDDGDITDEHIKDLRIAR